MSGIYIHLPFCVRKCAYCNFDSLPEVRWDAGFLRRYLEALLKEIQLDEREETPVDTIYFGGGTPSLVPPAEIGRLLEAIREKHDVSPDCEVTLEVNPGTVDRQSLEEFSGAGITRLSIGAQSLRDETLKILGRIHKRRDIFEVYHLAENAGFRSLGLDFILGAPGESLKLWRRSLQEIMELSPPHLSIYYLSAEPGTPLGDSILQGAIRAPGEEDLIRMSGETQALLTSSGYRRYEISNYALPGHECRHNYKYWRGASYRGYGSSACSYRRHWRWRAVTDPFEYARRIENGENPLEFAERISEQRQMGEYMMMGLRTAEGVSSRSFAERFGRDIIKVYGAIVSDLEGRGFIRRSPGEQTGEYHVLIPDKHWDIHNEIVEKFLPAE